MLLKKLLVSVFIFILIFSIYYTKNIKLDASSDSLILQNNKNFEYYKYYNNIFPTKNFLIIAIKSKNKIDKKYIENINNIINKLNKLENIESTYSIVDIPILLLNNRKIAELAKNEIENINNTKRNLNDVLNEFSNSPIFKDQIINYKKNISSIIIYLKKNNEFEKIKNKYRKNKSGKNEYKYQKKKYNDAKEILIKDIRNIITKQDKKYEYFLGGIDMIANDTINYVKNDIMIFSFAVIFLIIIVLFVIYRSIKWVIIPLFSTIYSLLIMTGIIGFVNWEITAISSNFISLMLILSISMNIHIINNYRIFLKDQNIYQTMRTMFWPCLYTTLTTIVAFGSLLFSDIKPIIDFGYVMIIGLIIILFTSFTILPLTISYFPKINISNNINFVILDKFFKYSTKYCGIIILINLLVFLISVYGIYQLNVENSFINYFKSNTEIHKGMKLIDRELGGTTPIDIIINFKNESNKHMLSEKSNTEDDIIFDDDLSIFDDLSINDEMVSYWFTKDKIDTIEEIHKYLESKDEIGKVQSLYTLIEMANKINKDNLSIFELSILYNEIPEDYKKLLINPYLSVEKNMIKISARIRDSNKIERDKLVKNIKYYLEKNFLNIDKFEVNGLLVLYNDMLQSLFSSQIKSFGIILLSIFFMFIILFQSFKLSIIAIIPNIIASSLILGLIGLLKIPLDIMTITIAAITIGITVDNTIHYIYRIKIKLNHDIETKKLIENTHNNVGKAVITTSLTIALGFLVLCLSNFIPTILFGLFTSLAMIIAMVGVLVTLPAIMIKFKI